MILGGKVMSFCMNCGTELPQTAKFCFACGQKVEIPFKSENKNTDGQSTKENKQKQKSTVENNKSKIIGSNKTDKQQGEKFLIDGNTLFFDKDMMQVVNLRKKFYENAWKQKCVFESYYSNQIHTIEDLFAKGLDYYSKCLNESLKQGVFTLSERGVDWISIDELYDYISDAGISMEKIWQPLFEAVNEIENQAKLMSTYRELKKAGRGHWVGGGFGISGAIKGAVTAGAFNMTSGAIHKIFDGISNMGDKLKIQQMEESLVNSNSTKELLVNGIYDYCVSIGIQVHFILSRENRIIYYYESATNSSNKISNSLMMYKSHKIKKREVVKKICEAIEDYPFCPEFYEVLYSITPESENEILKIVKLLGIQGNFKDRTAEMRKEYHYRKETEEQEKRLKEERENAYRNCMEEVKGVSGNDIEALKKKIEIIDGYKISFPDVNFDDERDSIVQQIECVQMKMYDDLHNEVEKIFCNESNVSSQDAERVLLKIEDFIANYSKENTPKEIVERDYERLQVEIKKIREKEWNVAQKRIEDIVKNPGDTLCDIQNQIFELKAISKQFNNVYSYYIEPYINELTEVAFGKLVLSVLKKYYMQIPANCEFQIKGNLDLQKLNNVIRTVFFDVNQNRVLGVCDTTVFGNGKRGYIFTDTEVYYKEILSKVGKIEYKNIKRVEVIQKKKADNDNELCFHLYKGEDVIWIDNFINKTPLLHFFEDLIKFRKDPFVFINSKRLRRQYNIDINNSTVMSENDTKSQGIMTRRQNKMSHEEMIALLIKHKNLAACSNFYIKDAIPSEKLDNALREYAYDVDVSKIIGLYDTTPCGSGAEGYLFTDTEIYFHKANNKTKKIQYDDILDVKLIEKGNNDTNNEIEVLMTEGSRIIWYDLFINKTPLYEFFQELLWE